eukprot:3331694-Prymnesium_polylepis.2
MSAPQPSEASLGSSARPRFAADASSSAVMHFRFEKMAALWTASGRRDLERRRGGESSLAAACAALASLAAWRPLTAAFAPNSTGAAAGLFSLAGAAGTAATS